MTTIAYTVHTADLLHLGYSAADIATYVTALEAALVAAYPGAEVSVTALDRVSGGNVIRIEADENEHGIRDHVREIADRTLAA